MSLKMKITLGVTGSVLLTMLAGLFAMRIFVVRGFSHLEDERALRNIERCVNAIKNEQEHLDSVLHNLSSSDSAYRFAVDKDKRLAPEYFSWDALKAGNLNCMAMYGTEGQLLGSGAFDLHTREAIPLMTLLPEGFSIQKDFSKPVSGMVMTPLGPLLLCARPILNSQGWGPARGVMLVGRLLDADLLAVLQSQVRLTFSLVPLPTAPAGMRQALASITAENPVFLDKSDDDVLQAYTSIPDIQGKPVFAIQATLPRQDTLQGERILTSSMLFVLCSSLVVLGFVLVILDRSVTGPLRDITRHIAGIKDTRDLGKLLPADRADEVGILAGAFNRMSADLTRLYEQLDSQHDFLQLLLSNIPHPICVQDADGQLLMANPAHIRLMEISCPPEEMSGLSAEIAEVLATGQPLFLAEEHCLTVSNVSRWFETTWLPLVDERGARLRVLTVRMEITERKLAGEAIKESERRFKELFQSMNEGVCVHELVRDASGHPVDYRIVDVNTQFEEILGISRQAAVGTLASELYRSPDGPPFLDVYARVAETGESANFETFFPPMNKHFTISTFSPKPGFFATVFQDTTARTRADKEIRRAHNFIQRILDSMPSLVVGVDESLHVTHWNRAAAEVTGLAAAETLGRPLLDALPRLSPYVDAVRNALSDGQAVSRRKLPFVLEDQTRQADLLIFPLSGPEGVHSAVIRLDDVTERVRMDELLLQTEKMMSVGGLAAGMAHEINNPLAGIIQSAQNLERRLEAGRASNQKAAADCGLPMGAMNCYLLARDIPSLLAGILDSGRRAARLVVNMLSFVRGGSSVSQMASLPEMVDKAVSIASTEYDMSKKYDFLHIAISREYAPDLPLVSCSPGEIEQVLLNLLQNAAQALAKDPNPVEPPRIVLRVYVREDQAVIEVEDNGPGMDEHLRRKVFEPFFTTKSPGEGTGLGLSVSYFIITSNHQGAIRVESEPGMGARFIVSLPLNPVHPAGAKGNVQ